ncbi:MAG TPA: hypothetical protein VF209_01690 [Patescibacteria group bacterium]
MTEKPPRHQVTEAIQAQELSFQVLDDTGAEIGVRFVHKGSIGAEIVSHSTEITISTPQVTVIIDENEQPQVFPSEAILTAGVQALVDKLQREKIKIGQILKTSPDKKTQLRIIIES